MQFIDKTIREIAIEAPLSTRVFEEVGIDYCCGGHVNFVEACNKAGVDPAFVQKTLDLVLEGTPDLEHPLEDLSAGELCDHIVETHHVFTRNELSRLTPLMEAVTHKHRAGHPELIQLNESLNELLSELLVHMRKEEEILFPYIKELESAAIADRTAAVPYFGTVRNPLRVMMTEHDAAGDILKKMRQCSSDYTTPADACPSFAALYTGLEVLEKDIHRHIHLENNLLFIRAVEMEDRSISRNSALASKLAA